MYPAIPTTIIANDHVVISQYLHQLIIRAYIEPRYIGYLQYKFKWNYDTIDSIAWKSLSFTVNHINNLVLIAKIYNSLLPTTMGLKSGNNNIMIIKFYVTLKRHRLT